MKFMATEKNSQISHVVLSKDELSRTVDTDQTNDAQKDDTGLEWKHILKLSSYLYARFPISLKHKRATNRLGVYEEMTST